MVRSLTVALGVLAAAPAHAGLLEAKQAFAIGAEVGAGGRWFDHLAIDDHQAWGLELGARTEVNLLVHVRADAHYLEPFQGGEGRLFSLSTAARSPKLFVFALDLHELYWRASTRPGDDLLYADAGLAVVGDLLGTLKGSLGFTYVGAPGLDVDTRQKGYGAYVGLEYVLRTKIFEATARGTLFVAFSDGKAHLGLTTDADAMIRIPVKGVFLGPRVGVAYRNLGLRGDPLFGQRQELTGTAAFAFLWGTGAGKSGPAKKKADDADEG